MQNAKLLMYKFLFNQGAQCETHFLGGCKKASNHDDENQSQEVDIERKA